MIHDVVIRPIALSGPDDARFSPFGTCFTLASIANRVSVPLQFEAEPVLGTSTLTVITAPFRIRGVARLERHPFSVQAFLPLTHGPLVTIVASPGSPPERAEQLSAFLIPAGHGIAYRTSVWHCGLMGFETDATVVSFVRRTDDGSDTEFVDLSFSIRIAESI